VIPALRLSNVQPGITSLSIFGDGPRWLEK